MLQSLSPYIAAGAKSAADKSAASASAGDAQNSEESFAVGERVWVNGNKPGYIQFLGETQFAPGQWAGIVLDEPIGKNDGSVAGVRYFQCEALRGIFTRPSKLSRTEGEANGTQTAPPSRAASPTPSVSSVASHTPATKSTLPSTTTAAKKASTASPATPSSNLARTNSESISNLSETGSVKKGERELKMGDRVLVKTCWIILNKKGNHMGVSGDPFSVKCNYLRDESTIHWHLPLDVTKPPCLNQKLSVSAPINLTQSVVVTSGTQPCWSDYILMNRPSFLLTDSLFSPFPQPVGCVRKCYSCPPGWRGNVLSPSKVWCHVGLAAVHF